MSLLIQLFSRWSDPKIPEIIRTLFIVGGLLASAVQWKTYMASDV